jgi:hypothetical protein
MPIEGCGRIRNRVLSQAVAVEKEVCMFPQRKVRCQFAALVHDLI